MCRIQWVLLSVILCACQTGGGASVSAVRSPSSTETSGGERSGELGTQEDAVGDATERSGDVLEQDVTVLSTVPVPVPLPAVPRDSLSTALQQVWTRVEEQVSNVRPAGPEDTTVANVQAWAEGAFLAWINERREAIDATHRLLAHVPDAPPYERALALALFAYVFEDLGAQIAGAPVPEEITGREDLLGIYIQSLNDASKPLGVRAVEFYADCQRRLAILGDASEWLPWRAYCVQRGREVIEGYHLDPHPVSVPETTEIIESSPIPES